VTRHVTFYAALAAIALAAGAVAVGFTWQPGLATFHDDSASYLVMAQAFSPWQAAGAAVAAQMPYEKYPPLFPALLALAGAAHDWRWAHAIVSLSFAAAIVALGVYAARASASSACGIVAALLFAALPGMWLNMKGILSEFPYMALTFATLAWLAARPAGTPLARRHAFALGALLAAVMLTRTIGFTLALAVVVAEIASYMRTRDRARLREIVFALAIALAATFLWYVLRPAGGEDAYVSSSVGVVERARDEGAGWLATLAWRNANALFEAWLNAFVIYWGEWWQPKFVAGTAIAVVGLAAVAWRAWQRQADGLYAAFFLAVLIAWPFPGQMYRLALPIFPLVLAVLVCVAFDVPRARLGAPRGTRAIAYGAAVPLAFCVPALFYIADRAGQPGKDIMEYYRIPFRPDAEASAERQARAFEDMARIRDTTPPGARVMAYGPTYIALLASRRGVPLDYPQSAADFAAQLARGRPDYVYLSRVHPRDSAQRLGDPFAPARFLDGRADAVWWRPGADGTPQAALFKVRAQAVEGAH
jgi:hypothetical protein